MEGYIRGDSLAASPTMGLREKKTFALGRDTLSHHSASVFQIRECFSIPALKGS